MHDTNQMETNSTHPEEEYVFPVPNTIEIYDLDRRRMDDYVHAFGAHQQGYRTRIGHSTAGSHVCHYDCYRGGYPRGGQAVVGTTRSLRIGCQFRLSARFLPNQMCWLLIHTHLKHNHPHDPNVKPRKKPPAPDPILPHPYHLNLDANLEDPSSFPLPSTSTSKPDDTAAPTPNPSTTLYQPSDEIITHLLQKTTNNLTKRLQSLTPHRRHEAIQKIEAILMDQESSTPPREQPSTVNPSPIVQDVINTYHQSPNTVSPNLFLPETEVMQSLMLTDHVTSPEQPIEELNDPSINSIIDDFFGTSEFTKSTFNIEDLLFADAPPAPTHCTPPSSSPLPLTTSITNVPLAATTGATAALVTERERREQQLQLPASLPSPTGRLTRNRTRELAQKAAFEKSVLKELLAKYSIHRWLEPFVLNIREHWPFNTSAHSASIWPVPIFRYLNSVAFGSAFARLKPHTG
ncbi:uncharacterized protein MELLADRAFT_77137 [Melampsora larici-populina 98AG31]|uniref:FAR1 domain-containing protein n=1 Tax=Melampsora larici-populina (strain 98AG31 / pathotype 3-4-7) TaxID=747676 RepID=F4RDT5_MELLP|nr:uncharacterized protein MELLADRAFT_77137 [Melampsora larici-populina 98AG31]EGG09553.1 hypothetical protein MELLADRAFT_77137 [Melampsora larici-populina 98AG31]